MNRPFFPCAGSRALHAPTRREFVYGLGASLGSVALTSLLAADQTHPLAPKQPHVPAAKAKNVIFLMMEGGPSHIDTFDPKPMLEKMHLKEFVREGKQKSAMESGKRYYVRSPFQFIKARSKRRRHGGELEHLARSPMTSASSAAAPWTA
jgi:hypothetical protein